MNDQIILQILQTHTLTAIDNSLTPDLPVKFLGTAFTIPDDQKWLEFIFFPNNRNGDFWGSEQNHTGSIRLVLHWPNESAGVYEPMRVLGSIADQFPKGLRLQSVEICDKPTTNGVLEQGKEILLPCTIRYQCFSDQ